jgi:hypothetical protein
LKFGTEKALDECLVAGVLLVRVLRGRHGDLGAIPEAQGERLLELE